MPLTIEEVFGKVLKGKAVIVDARPRSCGRADSSGVSRP